MKIILGILLIFITNPALAETFDESVYEKEIIDAMEADAQYRRHEQNMVEQIKKLDLDSQLKEAEARNQEALLKLRDAKSKSPKVITQNTADGTAESDYVKPRLNLKYLAVGQHVKEAILNIEESAYLVNEGDQPIQGVTVDGIYDDKVTISFFDQSQMDYKINFLTE